MINIKNYVLEEIDNLKLQDNSYESYQKLSEGFNILGIKNKILNVNYLFDSMDYYFMIVKQFDEFFYLIDLNLDTKCFELTTDSLEKYLESLKIYNNTLSISDIYSKRSIR